MAKCNPLTFLPFKALTSIRGMWSSAGYSRQLFSAGDFDP